MRRREVDAKAAAEAEVLVEGNGASRGAGQGTVRFLRSALELNKIAKGDVLAAERTDPDMVPGMRVASAIMADVGGDTRPLPRVSWASPPSSASNAWMCCALWTG